MPGSGIHMEMKRFYDKIVDENPDLIKYLKETKKLLMRFQEHKFLTNN